MIATGYKNGQQILQINKPQITQADADTYAGSIDSLVVDGGLTYYPSTPDPVPGVKSALVGREKNARDALADCKAKAFVALKSAGMTTEEANAAGTALVVQHYGLMGAYELAGGNPAAKAALMTAIEADPPAWWSPAIAAIFDEAL